MWKSKQNYSENKDKHDCVAQLFKVIDNLQENLNKDTKGLIKENLNLKTEVEFLKSKLLKENNSLIADTNSEKDSSKNEIRDIMNSIYKGDKIPRAMNRSINSTSNSSNYSEKTCNKIIAFTSTNSHSNIRESLFDQSKNKLKTIIPNLTQSRPPSIKIKSIKEKFPPSST